MLIKLEQMAPVGQIPQTRITWTLREALNGSIPVSFFSTPKYAAKQLSYLVSTRTWFDKSLALNLFDTLAFQKLVVEHVAPYSAEEERIVKEGIGHFAFFDAQLKRQAVKGISPVSAEEIWMDPAKSGVCWGRNKIKSEFSRASEGCARLK